MIEPVAPVVVGAAAAGAVVATGLAVTHAGMDVAAWTMVAATIGGIVGQFLTYQKHKGDRDDAARSRILEHQWLLEQREFDRVERERAAAELKAETAHLALSVAQGHAVLVEKVIEQTAMNKEALDAANGITQKISQAGLQLRGASRQTDHIEALSVDTNKVVHDLEEKT